MASDNLDDYDLPEAFYVRRPRERLLVDIESNVAEAVERLGDYFSYMDKKTILGGTLSILLVGLLLEDTAEGVDAFERLIAAHPPTQALDTNRVWGEFMSLHEYFRIKYQTNTLLREALEEMLPSDLRVWPEEFFEVQWTPGCNYILVG